MKTEDGKRIIAEFNIICSIFGHKYRLLRIVTKRTRELYCKRCKKEFGTNDDFKNILPLDDELRKAHDLMIQWDLEFRLKYGNDYLRL